MMTVPEYFGCKAFDDRVMKARLSQPCLLYTSHLDAMAVKGGAHSFQQGIVDVPVVIRSGPDPNHILNAAVLIGVEPDGRGGIGEDLGELLHYLPQGGFRCV